MERNIIDVVKKRMDSLKQGKVEDRWVAAGWDENGKIFLGLCENSIEKVKLAIETLCCISKGRQLIGKVIAVSEDQPLSVTVLFENDRKGKFLKNSFKIQFTPEQILLVFG